MNKMDGLRAGAKEMRSVAQRLNQWADDLEASFQDHETPEKEVPASVPVQPGKRKKADGRKDAAPGGEAAAGTTEKAEKPLILPEVRSVLAGKCAAGFSTQVKALIESYGASSLKEVPAEKYGELLEAVAGLGADTGGDADAG